MQLRYGRRLILARLDMRSILLAGATGLIGVELLARLLRDDGFDGRVIAPTRRPIGLNHPKLINLVVDATNRSDETMINILREAGVEQLDAYACCLGSTIRKAGSRAMFAAVDHNLVLRWGRIAASFGARHALLVSSVGADPGSRNFYLRVKGETEHDLTQLDFTRVDLMRPGQLLGAREESRPMEALAQIAARAYSRLLTGTLSCYRGIAAADVADAMTALIVTPAPERGVRIHHYDQMRELAASR